MARYLRTFPAVGFEPGGWGWGGAKAYRRGRVAALYLGKVRRFLAFVRAGVSDWNFATYIKVRRFLAALLRTLGGGIRDTSSVIRRRKAIEVGALYFGKVRRFLALVRAGASLAISTSYIKVRRFHGEMLRTLAAGAGGDEAARLQRGSRMRLRKSAGRSIGAR